MGKSGPEEIIKASEGIGPFDDELSDDLQSQVQFFTLKQPVIPTGAREAADFLGNVCDGIVSGKKMPVVLGGDHTITMGALSALTRRYRSVSLVIIDSHLDFVDPDSEGLTRNNWLGHALNLPNVQNAVILGARSYRKTEWDYWKRNMGKLVVYEAGEQAGWNLDMTIDVLEDYIYVSFDLDALDPSLMPATASPQPLGLDFRQALTALRTVIPRRNIIGMDLCNLNPVPGLKAPNFLAAALLKKMILYAFKGKELMGK